MRGLTLEVALDRLLDLLPLLFITLIGTIILEFAIYFLLTRVFRTKYALPFTLVAPAAVALAIFTVYPFVFNVQLAFSDLRLKTISCYIPNTDITNAPCSLGQAALNVDVNINVDDMALRADPAETASVAYTLQQGDEVYVVARSKALGYVVGTGFATSETGTVCNPLDTDCIRRQREAEATREIQDERDWWLVRTPNGEEGWIPDVTFIMSEAGEIYTEAQAGGEVLGSVAAGDSVRLVKRESTTWYQIETAGGDLGWVTAEPRQINLYIAASSAPIYESQSTESALVGELGTGQDVNILRNQPLTWYEVETEDGTAWINAELSVTEFYTSSVEIPLLSAATFSAEALDPLPAEQSARMLATTRETWTSVRTLEGASGWVSVEPQTQEAFEMPDTKPILSAPEGEELGEVEIGALVASLGSTTVEEVIWYNIQTEEGLSGWVDVQPETFTEIVIIPEETILLADLESALVVETLPAGTPVQAFESGELTWYELRLADGTTGFTNLAPENITEQYTTSEEIPAYAAFNDTTAVLTTFPAETELKIVATQDAPWYQIQTRTGERIIGWVNLEPAETRLIFAASEDESLRVDPSFLAETDGEVASGDTVTTLDDTTAYWYQIRTADATVGWVEAVPDQVVTTERDIVLYSLGYGWDNFKRVFVDEDPATGEIRGWGRLLQTENSTFPRLMQVTLIWTFFNVLFHLLFGMILALILNQPNLRFKAIYRTVIILPWAIPQVIISLAWRGEFNFQFGFVNGLLGEFGIEPVQWLFSPVPALVAVTFVNIWLGIPFYMVTLLGGLQSIPPDYYEAAALDGASAFERFRNITVPLIRPVAVPIITLDVIWTFNNFNMIYLITEGNPNESTNILVTALYNAAFGANGQFQLGFAAAFSLVIFAVLLVFASLWIVQTGALKGIYEK